MIFHRVITAVDEELRAIDKRLAARTEARAEPRPKWMGGLSMEIIEAEVCDWTRFASWRKVGCFAGLTGGVSASGQSYSDLSITKVGNRRLRKALIETAWRFCRHQEEYWLTKKWAHILKTGAKAHRRLRKKAIVAYARQLLVDLWRWKTGRVTAQQLGWEMISE